MNKQRLAVIGAGVSGLTVAQLLKDKYEIKVFEKDSRPGGLIKCESKCPKHGPHQIWRLR